LDRKRRRRVLEQINTSLTRSAGACCVPTSRAPAVSVRNDRKKGVKSKVRFIRGVDQPPVDKNAVTWPRL
jgi:hypothetical protein